jgi:hypothetical protein
MPKQRFANSFLEITGSRLTSTCDTNGQFGCKVRRNGSPSRDAQNLQYHPGSDCSVEMRCQSSDENAEHLTAPFVFVNSRNVAPAWACPLSAFQSSQDR